MIKCYHQKITTNEMLKLHGELHIMTAIGAAHVIDMVLTLYSWTKWNQTSMGSLQHTGELCLSQVS